MTAAPGEQPEQTADGSQTLERGLAVLVELGRHPDGLTTSQVAAACRLHRSIANRLLVSLHRTGFAARDGAGRYVVGPTATDLADRARPRLRDVAEPVLRRLAREVDATASLVEVVGDAAISTVVAEPPTDGPRFSYRLGNRDPLDRGAGGLAALASGPPRGGEPARVAAVRAAGHITTYAELNPGAYGIAAPLPGWDVLASVNIVTAHERLTTDAIAPLLAAVRDIGRPADVGPQ
jgi:DNA-binding IclR family transcriptional regulator